MAKHKNTPVNARTRGIRTTAAGAVLAVASALAVVLSLAGSQPVLAHPAAGYAVIKTYPNPAPATNEEFGNALALAAGGTQLVVAAQGDRLGGPTAIGAVYVLTTTNGLVSRAITETAGAADDFFGHSMAVSNTSVLVGAPLRNNGPTANTGSAYIYDIVGGGLLQSFNEPSPQAQNQFGSSVAIISDTAVLVGVPYYDSGPGDEGRAYICLIADGSCPIALDSPSAFGAGHFGLSVLALGDYFAIAAPQDGIHGTVYVYTTTTAELYKTITPTGPTSGDYFGSSLAAVNGNLLIGAQNGGTSFVNTPGAAYLYSPAGIFLHKFNNPDASDVGALFGAAVAGDGNIVLIGAPQATVNEAGDGRAYVFNASSGALIDTLQKTAPVGGDHFGNAVDMLGETFIVSAPDDALGAAGAGVVYRFGPSPPSFELSSKTVNSTEVKAGDLFTYTVTVRNSGTLSGSFALTDTLDANLSLVSAPGMAGTTTLTASGVITGGAQVSLTIGVQSSQPLNAIIANVVHLSGDGSVRSVSAPLVNIGHRLFLPVVGR